MDISVIIPVYDEEGSVKEIHVKLTKVLSELNTKYEIIFIDDGSHDSTLKRLLKLQKADKHVKILSFQRNFGKSAALMAGFVAAKGNLVITMDGDLQDEPMEIPRFIKKLNSGYDLVVGWKFIRHDPVSKTLPSKFFNWLTITLTGANVHDSNCGYKGYKKKVVKHLRLAKGFHRYIPALAKWKGYKIGELKVTHHPREHGISKYGPMRLINGLLDLMALKLIYSKNKKLNYIFSKTGLLLGLVLFSTGAGFVLINTLFNDFRCVHQYLPIASVLILTGILLLSSSLLGKMCLTMRNSTQQYILKKI